MNADVDKAGPPLPRANPLLIGQAAAEARRNARKTQWVPGFDVEELLPLPLEEARRRMNIGETRVYNAIPDEIKNSLLKPKVKQTQAERDAQAQTAAS